MCKSEWREQVNHIRDNSKSEGRLNIFRIIKCDLVTESYVAIEWSVGVRRVLAGLCAGWLLLGVETGRYTGYLTTNRHVPYVTLGRRRTNTISDYLSHL